MELSFLMVSECIFFFLDFLIFWVCFPLIALNTKCLITKEEKTRLYEIKIAADLYWKHISRLFLLSLLSFAE